jgi:hypothetical protein
VITGGEVHGHGRMQELTTVLLSYLSRAGMTGKMEFDLSPR